MSSKKIIEYNQDFYLLDQDVYEPDEVFYSRAWYILNKLHSKDNKDDFNTLVKMSRILANIQNYKCEFSCLAGARSGLGEFFPMRV